MAGDWIKMRLDLSDDPAVIGIAAELGVDEYAIVGRLHKLWSWADRQSRDGHAASVTEKWIDRYVERDGFAAAMAKAGWLKVNGVGVSFPNFDRHNGESAKKRALASNRQRNARVTSSSRKQRDSSVTREEKRESNKPPVSPLTLPAGVTVEDWQAFRDHRSKLRKPMTPRAEQLALEKLVELSSQGYDPKKTLNHAIEAGWQTFFPRDDCRAVVTAPEREKAQACPCGQAGTVKVGGKWRCSAHVRTDFQTAARAA